MTVRFSVVIPAYGEEHRMARTIAQLREALSTMEGGLEIIVVDDGSGDRTAAAAAEAAADQVIRLPVNRGKGAAVRAGVLAAGGRSIAFTDADLSYPPVQLLDLLAAVEGGADVVLGSRRLTGATTLVPAARLRAVSGRLFNFVTRVLLTGVLSNHYSDTQCGIKAFSSEAGHLLFGLGRLDRFAFDVELVCLAERNGLVVREIPVALASAEGSTVHLGADALRMLADLVRLRRWVKAGVYDPGKLRQQ